MKKTKSYFLAVLSVGILVGSLVLSGAYSSQAAPGPPQQDVNVINNPDHPVPTRAQGTTAINGTVQAEQSGNWNVAITGTPTVQLGNTSDNPVWVRDVDNPARQPFSQNLTLTLPQGQQLGLIGFQVPDGKRLVIEFISANSEVPAGEKDVFLIQALANSIGYTHYLTATYQANFSGFDSFVISQPIRMCADPSTTVRFQLVRSAATDNGGFTFNVSGYLVDAQ